MPRSSKLSERMEFDHVVTVWPGGMLSDDSGLHAPESYIETLDDDAGSILKEHEDTWRQSMHDAGWEVFTDGYSAQCSYSGPIMHASEFIGGQLERDILDRPGFYVAVSVECLPREGEEETESAGWAVLRRDFPHADYPHTPGYLHGCAACEAECRCTGDRSLTNCVASEHDNPNQPGDVE